MNEEMDALLCRSTWILVKHLARVKLMLYHWVYIIKHNLDGIVNRYKAKLIAMGFRQISDVNYLDTFSCVAWLNSVCFVSLVVNLHWQLH